MTVISMQQNKYVFELEQSPYKKGTCPNCNKTNCFRYYKNLPREYGICDHKNNCNYHNKPSEQPNEIKKELYKMVNNTLPNIEPIKLKKLVQPNETQLKVLENYNSTFHKFCTEVLNIPLNHLKKWNVGTDNWNNTSFVLQDITGKHVHVKYTEFLITKDGKDCKRNKDKEPNPFYLKAKENEQYKKCLYGEHLITDDKIICLVEAEKTAIIADYFYSQYNWVATGGASGAKVEAFNALKGKEVYYISDNDKAGQDNSTLKYLELSGIDFKIVNLPTLKHKEDIADLIIRGERPEIKPIEKVEHKEYVFYKAVYEKNEDEEKRTIKDVKINFTIWIELILSMGYRRFDLDTKEYIFIKIKNQIVSEVTIKQIQDEFIEYVKNLNTKQVNEEIKGAIIEKFYKNIGFYFNENRLSLLKHNEPFTFNCDTKSESFVYYKNGYVKINSTGWELLNYNTLKGCIWYNQIIDREFNKISLQDTTQNKVSVFSKFMNNISGDTERFLSLCSIVGYNLHSFFETKLKATILTDSTTSEEAEGRTGKGLFSKALSFIRSYVEISGKNFDLNDKYRYSKCSLDTQIIHNSDVKKYFDFENLYNDITEGITVDKKNQQPYSLRVKYILSTNKSIKIDGSSSRDRCIEFELTDHYNDKLQPSDDFKHWFYTDWDKTEWSKFDNFMMYCINYYFLNGLVQPKEINLGKRKLIDQTCTEFIEFMSNKDIKENKKYSRDEWHKEFLENYPDLQQDKFKRQIKTFTQYLKVFASSSHKFKKLIQGENLTRSNNTNYVEFYVK